MAQIKKTILDKDLKKVGALQAAQYGPAALSLKLGLAGLFLVAILILTFLSLGRWI